MDIHIFVNGPSWMLPRLQELFNFGGKADRFTWIDSMSSYVHTNNFIECIIYNSLDHLISTDYMYKNVMYSQVMMRQKTRRHLRR